MRQLHSKLIILIAVLLAGVVLAKATNEGEQDQPAVQFEYVIYEPAELLELRQITHPDAKGEAAAMVQLNVLGKQGWELFEIANGHLYLKRQLQ